MKSVKKIITPLQSHFRSSLRRTSTIASTTAAFPQTDGGNVKTFSELPGPTGLHDIPYLGMALNFKPFSKFKIVLARFLFYFFFILQIIILMIIILYLKRIKSRIIKILNSEENSKRKVPNQIAQSKAQTH